MTIFSKIDKSSSSNKHTISLKVCAVAKCTIILPKKDPREHGQKQFV